MFQFPPFTPLVKKICIAVGASSILVLLLDRLAGMVWLFDALALSRVGVRQLGPVVWLWQVVTHAFVDAPAPGMVLGLGMGLLFFWIMGAPFEIRFGARTLFKLLTVCVLTSGLAAIVVMAIPGPLGDGAVYGVSPMLVGLITGQAATGPLSTRISFFGVLPMTQRTLLIAFGAFMLLMAISSGAYLGLISDVAAGFAGYYYIKALLRPRAAPKKKAKAKAKNPRGFTVIEGGGNGEDDELPKWLN